MPLTFSCQPPSRRPKAARARTAAPPEILSKTGGCRLCDTRDFGTTAHRSPRRNCGCRKRSFQTIQQRVRRRPSFERRAEVARNAFPYRNQLCDLAVIPPFLSRGTCSSRPSSHTPSSLCHCVRRSEVHTAASSPFSAPAGVHFGLRRQNHLVDEQKRRDSRPASAAATAFPVCSLQRRPCRI